MISLYDNARKARYCSPDTVVVPLELAESALIDAVNDERRRFGLRSVERCDEVHTDSP